jgi:hypothetical protein
MSFFWSRRIHNEYQQRHDAEITTQSNNVAFAVHVLSILSLLTHLQIGYYGGIANLQPSPVIGYMMLGVVSMFLVYLLHVWGL